jgi:ribosomal protein L11 methyltransferase
MPPERWLEVTVRTSMDVEMVSPVLVDLCGTAVEERGDEVVTYLPPPSDVELFIGTLRENLQAMDPSAPVELSWRWQAHKDWEVLWRRGLGPRKISDRIVVAPSWETFHPEPGQILLTLDPGMAFGTAEHPTTRGCLRILDGLVNDGDRLADVGAGSGILSIAAAQLGAREVLALEMDAMSCETALENVARNGVQDRVEIRQALVEGDVPLPGSPYQGIVANLQSHIILTILSSLLGSLHPGGWLILSGILVEQHEGILAAAQAGGLIHLGEDREGDWWTGVFRLRPHLP